MPAGQPFERKIPMSAAINAKSAGARATIAANLLKTTKTYSEGGHGLCRSFDDCFEMCDGDEVFEILCTRALSDAALVAGMERHGFKSALERVQTMKVQRTFDSIGALTQPATFKGEPLPDPTKITQRLTVERDLQRKKLAHFQPALTPDVPDAAGQVSMF